MVDVMGVTKDRIHQFVGPRGGSACGYLLDTGAVCGRPEVQHEVDMMATPDAWPAWPRLPMKRSTPEDPWECGFIVEQDPKDAKILYIGTMFESAKDLPTKRYESFEEIYADGWRVD